MWISIDPSLTRPKDVVIHIPGYLTSMDVEGQSALIQPRSFSSSLGARNRRANTYFEVIAGTEGRMLATLAAGRVCSLDPQDPQPRCRARLIQATRPGQIHVGVRHLVNNQTFSRDLARLGVSGGSYMQPFIFELATSNRGPTASALSTRCMHPPASAAGRGHRGVVCLPHWRPTVEDGRSTAVSADMASTTLVFTGSEACGGADFGSCLNLRPRTASVDFILLPDGHYETKKHA